jgi:hypothetical protein
MAFQKIVKRGDALSIDEDNKSFTGYLIGVKQGVGKYKSNVWKFQTKEGNLVDVWGNTAIDTALLVGKDGDMDPALDKCCIRLSFKGMKPMGKDKRGKEKNPMTMIDVEVDTANKLKAKKLPF